MTSPMNLSAGSEEVAQPKSSRKHKKQKWTHTEPRAIQRSAVRDNLNKDHLAPSEQANVVKFEKIESDSPFKSPSNSYLTQSSPTLPCQPFFRHQPDHDSLRQTVFYPISANGLVSAPVACFLPSTPSGRTSYRSIDHLSSKPSDDLPVPGPTLNQTAAVPASSENLRTNLTGNSRSYQGRDVKDEQRTPGGNCPPYSVLPSSSPFICHPRKSPPALQSSLEVYSGLDDAQAHHRTWAIIGDGSHTHVDDQCVPSVDNFGMAGRQASPDNLHDLDDLPSSSPRELSATGRLSNDAEKALENTFAELDCVIQKAQAVTGLSSKQIIKRWQPSNSRSSNLWNIYQKYFQTRPEEELSRLQRKGKHTGSTKACMKTIRASYQAFQKAEPNFKSILEVFRRIHDIDGSNTTVNGRWRHFLKYVNTMKRLAESASTINGFEIAFCAVGSVVQQDQSLSASYCSPMVQSFFADRLQLSDNEIEGHLKAHAYDYVSRSALSNGNIRNGSLIGTSMPLASEQLPTQPATPQCNRRSSEIKGQKRRLLKVLKDQFMKLVGPCKISQLRSSHFPFSDLPKILAQNGWILENWPEDVPFPCDLQKGRGIASLRACYRDSLMKAFDDRLYPVKVVKKYSEAMPPSEPIIIGIPPPPDSEYARGRRRFLDENQTVDRNGPARRTGPAIMDCKGREGVGAIESGMKRPEPCDGNKLDRVHAKKRRK